MVITSEIRNWTEAHDHCESIGANLLSIDTVEEEGFLNSILISSKEQLDAQWYWTDGINTTNEPNHSNFKWIWAGRNQSMEYTNWVTTGDHDGNFTRNNGSQCMRLSILANKTSGWISSSCSSRYHHICETRITI